MENEKTNEYQYKVSVITAVYNVEDYLEEMIESIIAQTIGIENIQLILVDDGSSDTSGEICDRYAAQYPENIVVVHKENGGVSSSRNEGLIHAKGEYINFTDADDKLSGNALNKMYDYLKENEEWIDLVAINMKYFGARQGKHPLDYKFQRTKIVELRTEYNFVQLSISGTLVKKSCFDNRKFDLELKYGEDAQLVVDILLDKMRYGVVWGAYYFYRKRATGDSAIDQGRKRPAYYIPCMKRFIMHILKTAQEKKGYIPQFVQYTCMYDLQWRLNRNVMVEPNVLTEDETKEYKELLLLALQHIDNNIILEQKNLGNNYKIAIVSLKENNKDKIELVKYPNDLKLCIEDITSACASSYSMVLEFADILKDEVIVEGYIRCFSELDSVEVIFKSSDPEIVAEYSAELFDRNEKQTLCMDEVITAAKGFRFRISRNDLPEEVRLCLCLRYAENDIVCKNIIFGKFFPISTKLKNTYYYQEGMILSHSGTCLKLCSNVDRKSIHRHEKLFQREILSKKNKMLRRGWIARNIYHVLKRFKKKEIWLISDRLTKADDNGEAFFTYMNTIGKQEHIETYFVLDKNSEDYERIRGIGNVISFHSTKHKILSLLCDKIISSQGEDYVFNRFYDLSYLYKDIQHHQKFVFLQHGVIKDDLSRWLTKANKNISIFVTTTRMEYQSILDCAYYYDENQVKCTGLPRYDYLCDNSQDKKIITFMPTWRSYLTGNIDVKTDTRTLKNGFENSSYCQMYRQVFSSPRLRDAAVKNHYEIQLMLHPAMPRECIEYFDCAETVKILDVTTRYRSLFADSKLIVTDYSSTVFDFAYLGKPVLYYQPDANEFFSGAHSYDKGYFDYERDGFGEVEYTAELLVERIIEYMENDCRLKDVYRDRIEKTFPYNDKNNCRRLYEEIVKL
ncbi:MAG: CDP-glycerol:glycerophosphate glycerophosphotransferase [Anaeroplasmataceae bacterium]|nr:CDP-glycerol:glycerophosphate glycerophosphotransferase [Anaeroplasmataceae bacterium]